ncbi:MAG: hypothetical protein K2I67_01625 [Malacoplasma sp.]|nr:hypothetical protein [Malacoplasma sp.]
MFQPKYIKKRKEKIAKKSLLRTQKYYHRNLYINSNLTNIKIIKIKNEQELIEQVAAKKNFDYDSVFLYGHKWTINTFLFRAKFDIIYCDSFYKVLKIDENIDRNKNIECPDKTFNIWICKSGFCLFNKINVGNQISTKPLYNKQ